jgi:hypothetical protein
MNLLIRLYRVALRLYPPGFRACFASEMEEVFAAGLEDARRRGCAWRFVLAEALHLPASLADVYTWALSASGGGRLVFSGAGGAPVPADAPGRRGWGESLLAGLPHLILGVLTTTSSLMYQIETLDTSLVAYLFLSMILLPSLVVLLFSLRKGWRLWSASWLVYMVIILFALASQLFDVLFPAGNSGGYYIAQILVIPLALAYLLYRAARRDVLRGLLVALPLMTMPWTYFSEFVPPGSIALAWLWLCALAFAAAVGMMRARSFTAALAMMLAVPLLGGFPFAWLGVYQGGTLPFSADGPSLIEVMRQYLPFAAGMIAVGLGPQLAVHLRAIDRTGGGHNPAYRLVLGGVLLALMIVVMGYAFYSSSVVGRLAQLLLTLQRTGIVLASGLYLAGFLLLVRAGQRNGLFSAQPDAAPRLAALFALLPGVPLALYCAIPDIYPQWLINPWLVYAVVYAWVLSAAWLVRAGLPARQS